MISRYTGHNQGVGEMLKPVAAEVCVRLVPEPPRCLHPFDTLDDADNPGGGGAPILEPKALYKRNRQKGPGRQNQVLSNI